MPVGACGISCDVCGRNVKGTCGTCAAGTDERAQKKLNAQMRLIKMHCPILACAVEKKVGYCLKDCEDFPCTRFESGFESVLGAVPFPYSTSFLTAHKRKPGSK